MLDNKALCQTVTSLVNNVIPSENLLVAFIAGSRATNNHKKNSDIDLFVILNNPSRAQEKKLALELRNMHEEYGLLFEHCGEIFSISTLDSLLQTARSLQPLFRNGFSSLACYQTDCILSIARKIKVVLHMLRMPKIFISGDMSALNRYVDFAERFYLKYGEPIPQLKVNSLRWDDQCNQSYKVIKRWKYFNNMLSTNDFLDTPIGIGLERWFIAPKCTERKTLEVGCPKIDSDLCPISSQKIVGSTRAIITSQCLGSE